VDWSSRVFLALKVILEFQKVFLGWPHRHAQNISSWPVYRSPFTLNFHEEVIESIGETGSIPRGNQANSASVSTVNVFKSSALVGC